MKLGLALAGGGVKGAAHIGVIKALEENGIHIDAIGGTSIGSIVAALYAMGYDTEKMLQLFKFFAKEIIKTDSKYFVNNIKTTRKLIGYGVLSGENIELAIHECAKEKNISNIQDIKMPLIIPTVDVKESKKYVFTNCNLEGKQYIKDCLIQKAVRASSSYPGVFAPCEYQGHKFVDGGILDNLPAGEVKKLGVDKILSIKLSSNLQSDPKNAYEVIFKSIDILFESRIKEAFDQSDFMLDLDLSEANMFNIKKIDYCYNMGYVNTIANMTKIKEILKKQ